MSQEDIEGTEMQDQGPQDQEPQEGVSRGLVIGLVAVAAVVVLLLILIVTGVFSGGDKETETPAPGEAQITILIPPTGSVVDITSPVTVSGSGSGLFEGNVVVQALDDAGNVLAEGATTIDSPEAGTGGEGPWTIDLTINTTPGTPGMIRAFSTSPVDGSVVAESSVQVTIGAAPAVESYVRIDEPGGGSQLDAGTPVIVKGMGAGLFEGNVVVQALDDQGNVLAEQPTIVQAQEVGGEGPWQVELSIQVAQETSATIRAFSPSPVEGEGNMGEDSVSVTFSMVAPPDDEVKLEDHLWLLMSYDSRQVLDGTMITAEFRDGQVSGRSGCNNYFTGYETTNGSITISEPVGLTQMFCEFPEGTMEQEGEYLGVLVQAASYQFEDGVMEVADASGNVILVYEAAVVGNVTALEGAQLPEGAVVEVTLSDVSRQDVAAEVIGRQVIENPGQFPFVYAVLYDAADIDPRFTYAVGVRITDSGGELLYINTSAYNVITGDNPSMIDVMVESV